MLEWIVDSGAGVNVIDRKRWDHLKKSSVRVDHQTKHPKKTLKAYGNHPIKAAGMFRTVATKEKSVNAEVYVIEGEGHCLLGRQTAEQLGIPNISLGGESRRR